MASAEREPGPAVEAGAPVLEAARRRGFYALMLAAERLLGERGRVGGVAGAPEEGLRLRHDPSLEFPVGEVSAVACPADPAAPLEITTTFLGLTGTVSPLPTYLVEEVAQEAAEADARSPRRDLLDLFHHRMLSFFHRARVEQDLAAQARSDLDDPWSARLLDFLGFGGDEREGGAIPRWRLLRLAALLAPPAASAAGLEAALTDVLGDALEPRGKVEVEQFVGSWIPLPEPDRTRLGGPSAALGRTLVVGQHIFDRSGTVIVRVGPLDRAGYLRFMQGDPLRAIDETVRLIAGDRVEHEVALWLEPDAAPPLALDSSGACRLGRNGWLGRQGQEAEVKVGAWRAGGGPIAASIRSQSTEARA